MGRAIPPTILAIVLVGAATACGGSSKTTSGTASAPAGTTTTSASPATQTNPNSGKDYPAIFTSNFMAACQKQGASHSACNCLLTHVETHVTYQTVVQEEQADTFTKSTEYHQAITACANR